MGKITVFIELKNATPLDYDGINKSMMKNDFQKENALDENDILYSINNDINDINTVLNLVKDIIKSINHLKGYSIEVSETGKETIKLSNVH